MAPGFNRYHALLKLIHLSFSRRELSRILTPIAHAMRECQATIERAAKSRDSDWFDAALDDESEVTENLVGVAFVVCQAFSNSIISRIRLLHVCHKQDFNKRLTTTSGEKRDILAFANPLVGSTKFSHMQAINAAADYFKHHSEWDNSWRLTKRNRETIAIVRALGASPGCSGNLRTMSKSLGNTSYHGTGMLSEIMTRWHARLHHAYSNELKAAGRI
jgi:hypothetical protein